MSHMRSCELYLILMCNRADELSTPLCILCVHPWQGHKMIYKMQDDNDDIRMKIQQPPIITLVPPDIQATAAREAFYLSRSTLIVLDTI